MAALLPELAPLLGEDAQAAAAGAFLAVLVARVRPAASASALVAVVAAVGDALAKNTKLAKPDLRAVALEVCIL